MVFDCVVWCAKYLLCIFNFIFFVLGTIIFGVGLWLAVDKHSLIALLKLVESERIEQFTQTQVIEQLAYVLIVIGAVMFFMSFLGYLGAMRESRCLLSTYATFLILLLVAGIVAGGLAAFYKEKVRAESKNFLQTTITSYTLGENVDASSLMWNQLMSNFGCCGVTDYHDFDASQAWQNSKGNRTIPEACCVLKDVADLVPRDEDCVTNPSDSNSFYKKGCYEVFTDWLIGQRELIIIVIGVGIVHLVLIILAFSLCKAFAKYNDMRL
ncbi:tetraspanin-9 [Drosophila madeirensis]|uniref:Tetraspanin n=2 Tax=obscura subgroup TaxID=32357 RepID=A0A3B0JUG8_DROGU|nr:tetraspanin-9 [Drosophila guanche]XP_034122150.1 tetraspanin-9 [Drosophila guanche]SPP77349.1 blast:Tetraspanin-9 [Drosophila guanche]